MVSRSVIFSLPSRLVYRPKHTTFGSLLTQDLRHGDDYRPVETLHASPRNLHDFSQYFGFCDVTRMPSHSQDGSTRDIGYWTTRGYANSRTGQVADWATRGCHRRLCVFIFRSFGHLLRPRVVQSASWQSASCPVTSSTVTSPCLQLPCYGPTKSRPEPSGSVRTEPSGARNSTVEHSERHKSHTNYMLTTCSVPQFCHVQDEHGK